jgi:hypothetical protein
MNLMKKDSAPLTVEWARWGKTPQDDEYRVLAWSGGSVGHASFTEALTRYSPGTLEKVVLPQVTIGWLPFRQSNYLAVGIHGVPDLGAGDLRKREVVFTNCFSMPYTQLAKGKVGYEPLVNKLKSVQVPPSGQEALDLSIEPGPDLVISLPRLPSSAFDATAMRAAALLLTGDPVCIVGADHISFDERIRFLDLVATLLPYGVRASLSVSTLVSSTFREHKFRLAFASTARSHDQAVMWNDPDATPVGHHQEELYLQWLHDNSPSEVMGRLTEMDEPIGFRPEEVNTLLKRLEANRRPPATAQDLLSPPIGEQQPDKIEQLLRTLAETIDDKRAFRDKVKMLGEHMDTNATTITEMSRRRYRNTIEQFGLLWKTLHVDKQIQKNFYLLLLRSAFKMPISYADFSAIEEHVLEKTKNRPQEQLLQAISSLELGGDAALLTWHAISSKELKEKLKHNYWTTKDFVFFANAKLKERHARIILEIVTRKLVDPGASNQDPDGFRAELQRCGYLAPALNSAFPGERAKQITILAQLVFAAHQGKLITNAEATEVVSDVNKKSAPNLFTVVNGMLKTPSTPEDRRDLLDALLPEPVLAGSLRRSLEKQLREGPTRDREAAGSGSNNAFRLRFRLREIRSLDLRSNELYYGFMFGFVIFLIIAVIGIWWLWPVLVRTFD